MNDALHGGEAWSHPCQRDRGRRRLAGSRFVAAGFICLSRNLARGNETDFQRLRFDNHAVDMAFDQIAIRNGSRILRFTSRGQVFADTVEHEGLDFRCRDSCNAACFVLSLLQDRMRHIIPVAHTELVGVRRAHAVAAVVKDATGQNGGRALEPDLSRDSVGGELGLHGLEQIAVEDRRMLPAVRASPR